MIIDRWFILTALLPCITSCFASEYGEDFYQEKNQKNDYFIIDRKNVDYLTPATVVSLRDSSVIDFKQISEKLGSLCNEYSWMSKKRFIYIFQSSKYSAMFDSFGVENIKRNKPVEKFVASYNPDDNSLTFYPLVPEKRRRIIMRSNWCKSRK